MMGLLYRAADALRRRVLADNHGRVGEDLAHRYLRRPRLHRRGAQLPPAFRAACEIDLVAWHAGTLVFVEVKTRAAAEFGNPDRAVDREKRST